MRRYYVNPPGDPVFTAMVEDLGSRCERPDELQAELRARYPAAVVRERGLAGDPVELWYVYRDGSWRPGGLEE